MDSLGFKLAGSSPESSVSQVKYQDALDEIAKLKKSSKEDDEYFLAKIDHLTKLVDDQDGIVLLNVYCTIEWSFLVMWYVLGGGVLFTATRKHK